MLSTLDKGHLVDLEQHPLLDQAECFKAMAMALINDDQRKLLEMSFEHEAQVDDLLGDTNLSGIGLRNSATYGSLLLETVQKANMKPNQLNALFDLIIVRKSSTRLIEFLKSKKTNKEFQSLATILAKHFRQYTRSGQIDSTFPLVNVLSSMPPMSVFRAIRLIGNSSVYLALAYLLNFSPTLQLNLVVPGQFISMLMKDFLRHFWNQVVKTSKNPNKNLYEKGFQESLLQGNLESR